MDTIKFLPTHCPLCSAQEDYTVLYKRNFEESDLNTEAYSARRVPDRIHYQIVRCNQDGMVRSNPVPEESFVYDLYKKSKFIYANETENLAVTYLAALDTALQQLSKDAKILEIGCGNGFLLKGLHAKGYGNVFGVEPSTEAVEKSDPLIRKQIIADVLQPTTFKPETFDLICFFQVLEHMPDPDQFLKLCYSLLSPGGFIVAFNHDAESLQAKILRERSPIIDVGHYCLFSKRTMEKIFRKNQLLPIKVFSPKNVVSLKHILLLVPFSKKLKMKLLGTKEGFWGWLLKRNICIKLGNLCLTAVKEKK